METKFLEADGLSGGRKRFSSFPKAESRRMERYRQKMLWLRYPAGRNATHFEAETPMNGLSLRDPQIIGTLAAAGLCLGGVAVYLATRKRPTEEEIERDRRSYLVQTGRIIDGTLLDISDLSPEESGRPNGMQLILYKYEIGGVVYECSQDVTLLRDMVNIYECRLGFPCSVRYDTHKPENSIIVAETWSGLRNTANSVPIRRMPSKSSRSRPARYT
jgi:uncharacterized protein DUF3592